MNSPQRPPEAPVAHHAVEATFRDVGGFCAAIFNAAPDGILISNPVGKILLANQQSAVIFGYSVNELLQMTIDDLVPRSVRSHHQNLRTHYFENPHTRPMGAGLDLIGERKDGVSIAIEISLSTFELDQKTCVIAIIRDVTQLRKMARELQQNNLELKRSNEDLDQFAAIASHDLQEPLRMIGGYTQLLQRRYKDKLDAQAMESLDFAMDGVKRLQGLIKDLLAFSRLTTQSRPFSPVDLDDVVSQVLCNLEVLIEEKHGEISLDHLPTLSGDEIQMIQLFQNLLANSLKFSSEKPVINISSAREGAFWKIRVRDNGIGIPLEYRERVFGIFQRLHHRETYSGSGVGLAICKRIVERHGGTIGIEDPSPDPQTSDPQTSDPNHPPLPGITIWFTIPRTPQMDPK